MSIASVIATLATRFAPGLTRKAHVNVLDYAPATPAGMANHQVVTDGVMAGGSVTITSASGLFTAADVGKKVWVAPTDRTTNPRTVVDGAITGGSNSFSSASAAFTSADQNRWLSVAGAGLAGGYLVTQITSVSNATTVLLNSNALTTVGARSTADGAATATVLTTATITSATAAFVAADVGCTITLAGAGVSGGLYTGVITTRTNATTVQVYPPISTTVAGAALNILGAPSTIMSLGTSSNIAQRTATDAVGVATQFTLTSTLAAYTQADMGRFVTIPGAASGGLQQTNQIIAVSGNVATLATAIITSVSGVTITLLGTRTVNDCAISSTSTQTTLSSSTATFAVTDIGGFVTIASAGVGSAPLVAQIVSVPNASTAILTTPAVNTIASGSCIIAPPGALAGTILSVQSPTQMTISDSASIACAGVSVGWATDDTPYIQAAFNDVVSGGTLTFPPGQIMPGAATASPYTISRAALLTTYGTSHYCLQFTTSNVHINGYGATILLAGGNSRSTTGVFLGDNVNPLTNVTVSGLIFDHNAKAGKNGVSSLLGGNTYIVPSQIGCAPIWCMDDFQAELNIRGPYTSYAQYPRAGQQFTRGIHVRDCTFMRSSAAGLETVCYVDEVNVTNCVFDGQGIWSSLLHMDGLAGGSITGSTFRDIIPNSGSAGWLSMAFNGDTGYRPCQRTVIAHNIIRNTKSSVPNVIGGGKAAIAGCFQNCSIVDNSIEGMVLYGVDLGTYASITTGFFAGSTHNVVEGNRIINCRYGVLVDGAPTGFNINGTTKAVRSGTANLGVNSANLNTWSGTAFTNDDIGCWIQVVGAGPNGATLMSQILAVNLGTGTSCTLAIANQSNGNLVGKAVTIGGQNGIASNFNRVFNNHIYCDSTNKFAGDYSGASYTTRTWPAGNVGVHIATSSAAPVGGNEFNNRIENMGNPFIDNSIGTGLTGALGTPTVYDTHRGYFGAASYVAAHCLVAHPEWINIYPETELGMAYGLGGTPPRNHQSQGALSWTPGAIAAGAQATTPATFTGAAVGDTCFANYGAALTAGLVLTADITSANTATVTITNTTGGPITPTATALLRVSWWGY